MNPKVLLKFRKLFRSITKDPNYRTNNEKDS